MKRSSFKPPTPEQMERNRRWKRATSLKASQGAQEKGRKPLAKGKGLKKRGKNYVKNRAEQFGDDGKREWIIDQPCDTCGASPPCDPSHYPSRGAGGKAEDMLPQCNDCHTRMHQIGVRLFMEGLGRPVAWLGRRTDHWEREWRVRQVLAELKKPNTELLKAFNLQVRELDKDSHREES